MYLPDCADWIDCVLEEADGREASGAHADARRCIVQSDAPDGQHWDRYRAANLLQGLDALWRPELLLRGGGENRPEEDVIGAVVLRRFRGF
jgi:hypothetical protein